MRKVQTVINWIRVTHLLFQVAFGAGATLTDFITAASAGVDVLALSSHMQFGWESPWMKLRASDTDVASDSAQIIIRIGLLSPRRRVRLRVSCLFGSLFIFPKLGVLPAEQPGVEHTKASGTARHVEEVMWDHGACSSLQLEHWPPASAGEKGRAVTGHPTGKHWWLTVLFFLPRFLLGPLTGFMAWCFRGKFCRCHPVHLLHLASERV